MMFFVIDILYLFFIFIIKNAPFGAFSFLFLQAQLRTLLVNVIVASAVTGLNVI